MSLRRTPFHGRHVASGARMVPFAGFEMPVQYAGVREEHVATRTAAGLFDVSHMGEVRFRGPKAEDALSWLLSNAVRKIEPGRAQYSAMCNAQGGVVDDVFVYRVAKDDFLVCVNAANREKDFAWMTANNGAGAEIVDEGDRWAQVALQGPRAPAIADLLTQDASKLERHQFRQATFAGVDDCLVARTGYTGEDGFEVFLPADRAEPVWDRVIEAGKPHGLVPVGLGARDTLRLEVRNALYGHELDDTHTPLQSGLGWVTKLGKPGGFLGMDAITARRDTDREVLVGMVLVGRRIAREGMEVRSDGARVGTVTSGTLGPSIERAVCLAWVDRDFAAPGTRLTIDVRGNEAVGVVVKGSFLEAAASVPN